MQTSLDTADREFYEKHWNFLDPREPALRDLAVQDLAVRCPVAASDAWQGFWVVNSHRDATAVLRDWETFSSGPDKRLPPRNDGNPPKPPVDVDPPVQRAFRHILNPYLTPAKVARFEPGIRELVTELIDGFVEAGTCELAEHFAKSFPGRMLYRFLFGIDDSEVPMVQAWTSRLVFEPTAPETAAAVQEWVQWTTNLIERRRNAPRQEDMIDGLLHATIDGEPLSDSEIAGCIRILILGGFSTTTDSILSAVLRLAEEPALQVRLRSNLSEIPRVLDEFLRFDPPIIGASRVCTRDTVLEGHEMKAGERLFVFFHPANRDPEEFENPNVLDLDRAQNRHLAFGAGVHRCIGSNVARLNLTIALEELLSRLDDIRIAPGETPTRQPGPTWGPLRLPLVFTPGERRTSTAVCEAP